MARILITGGTGLIGRALTTALLDKGHEVLILTRTKKKIEAQDKNLSYHHWDVAQQQLDRAAIEAADYIIHLAGANVAAARWTAKRKREIVESRTKSAALIVQALQTIPNNVKAVISTSAIGWYGPDPQIPNPSPFVETDTADDSFLGITCEQWEKSIEPVTALGIRLVTLRTGIVLSREGGAFAEFIKPVRLGAATILGLGAQIISWIHISDMVGICLHALENEQIQGVYNAVAPHPVSNKHLMLAMAKEKGGLAIPVRVPAFVLKMVLGEMSIEVLKSTTVSADKIKAAGYSFRFETIEAAVRDLMN